MVTVYDQLKSVRSRLKYRTLTEDKDEEDMTKDDRPNFPMCLSVPSDQATRRRLVVTGHSKDSCTNEVILVDIEDDCRCTTLGYLRTKLHPWTNCCALGDNLLVSFLGAQESEVWKFNMKTGNSSKLDRYLTPRWKHGMAAVDDKVYLVGGRTPSEGHNITDVESLEPETGTCEHLGHLVHYDCFYNMRCCVLDSGDLVVVGGEDAQGRPTLQIWSPAEDDLRASMPIAQKCGSIFGVVQVGGHVIVVGSCAVCVISLDDVMAGRHHGAVDVSEQYACPQHACAVVLSSDRILLVGGQRWDGSGPAEHCVYEASVQEVLSNTGPGWRPRDTQCLLRDCIIYGYTCTHWAPGVNCVLQ